MSYLDKFFEDEELEFHGLTKEEYVERFYNPSDDYNGLLTQIHRSNRMGGSFVKRGGISKTGS